MLKFIQYEGFRCCDCFRLGQINQVISSRVLSRHEPFFSTELPGICFPFAFRHSCHSVLPKLSKLISTPTNTTAPLADAPEQAWAKAWCPWNTPKGAGNRPRACPPAFRAASSGSCGGSRRAQGRRGLLRLYHYP